MAACGMYGCLCHQPIRLIFSSLTRTRIQRCVLCPLAGGALKACEGGDKWAHVVCVTWTPDMGFGDSTTLEPVVGVEHIPKARLRLVSQLTVAYVLMTVLSVV